MKMTPEKWRQRLHRSLELQKERREEALRFMRAYAGDYSDDGKKGLEGSKDDAAVNFIFAYVETVRPTILPGTPRAFIESEDPASDASAPHAQAVTNHFIRRLGVKDELKRVVHDWFFGFAAVFTDWEYAEQPRFEEDGKTPVFEMEEVEEEVLDPATQELVMQKKTQLVLDKKGKPVQAVDTITDRPRLEWLDPADVVYDLDAKNAKRHRWRARRIAETWGEFCERPGVTKEIRNKVRPKTLPKEMWRGGEGDAQHAPTEKNWVILWQIFDLENGRVLLLVDGEKVDFFVENIEWPYEMDVGGDRFPISILEAKWDYSNPYSFSSFKAYWHQIQERNRLRTIIQSTVRRSAPGWVGKKGALDKDQKEKFTKAKIGDYVEANNPENIHTRKHPELPKEFYAHDQQVADDTLNVSGLIEYNNDSIADTATEASILDQKSSIRKGEAKADFNDFCAVLFSKILQLCQQFLEEPVAVKIRKPESPQALSWMTVDGSQIQGDFTLNVKPGSDEQQTEGLRRQQDLKFGELMAQNPHVDQRKLAVRMARSFDIEADEILLPPDQVQQNLAAQADANKKPEKPPLDFSPIKVELLAPNLQAMIIAAALKMNGVPQLVGLPGEEGAGVPPGNLGGNPASPSLADPAPSLNSVMPGAEINQAPPTNDSAALPPATPVQPFSEMQGGPT